MSYESGSLECRRLVEIKENLIKTMQALDSLSSTEHITDRLKTIYNEIEEMHEERRKLENED
ncbi:MULTISPECIES: hypothetical protein [unclassified Prochlorococcus]|uniref:hypothetical protein n=1 Tax=unclassified Prochlorococcus TaxID=2627481 RepID=UPI00053376AA|nr:MULTISPECIES: hypothetical protein [unclassified Prochlorococcus]KGG15521.1 hypothetical protein EV06_1395 [Prochlorococcus sp. MIT 0602]KGG17801.1 hypothetical protein EV07_1243 [Prochlorococcus sp. MIT 0603]